MRDAEATRDIQQQVRGLSSSTRGLVLAILAIITPAGLVLVNVAAFVMGHLGVFRVGITVSAVLSTVVLNGLTAVTAYRLGQARWPDHWFFAEYRRNGLLAVFVFGLVFGATLAGVLTYQGLSDPGKLPNISTFIAGLIGLAIPLLAAFLLRDNMTRRQRRRYRTR
ncbi:MAG TPA: HupE/UreJ family protein [Candidatus Dormibacteraeota bacterium]|jgi:hypothetical protein|nr:HupE/UreJ family protein [Candidatus Dormibacteraeota bacterium]